MPNINSQVSGKPREIFPTAHPGVFYVIGIVPVMGSSGGNVGTLGAFSQMITVVPRSPSTKPWDKCSLLCSSAMTHENNQTQGFLFKKQIYHTHVQ